MEEISSKRGKMKLGQLSLVEIKELLKKEKKFKDLDSWKFEHISLGEMRHKYKLSKEKEVYFVKEIKPHEAQMEYFLTRLKLPHLPYSEYPNLLKKKLLVRKFISGRMLRSKNIDLGLLKDFIIMRNKLNHRAFFDRNNISSLKNFTQKDDGFYESGIRNDLVVCLNSLGRLKKYKLKVVDRFLEILQHLRENREEIIKDYVTMPFAKQHQDFREDNIIIGIDGKQRLIDWGSSYAYNPFMHDVSIFLVGNPKALEFYVKNADTCKKATKAQIDRWLYAALAVRFLELLRWRVKPSEERVNTREKCKKFLEYEYKTYKYLLKK